REREGRRRQHHGRPLRARRGRPRRRGRGRAEDGRPAGPPDHRRADGDRRARCGCRRPNAWRRPGRPPRGDRAARDPRRGRAPGPVLGHHAVSARTRELAGLIVAALLAGIALATVTIARDAEVSASAIAWGALFLALYLVAHVVVRRTVPYADGALLPLTAVLTVFGIVTIYRLDTADAGRPAVLGARRER